MTVEERRVRARSPHERVELSTEDVEGGSGVKGLSTGSPQLGIWRHLPVTWGPRVLRAKPLSGWGGRHAEGVGGRPGLSRGIGT